MHTMKTIKVITMMTLIGTSFSSIAQQDSSGVYSSAADFKNRKLAYAINCINEKHKIKLNEFLNQSFITVVHDQKSIKLQKKNIFGFRDCDNTISRFVGKSHYTILNPDEEILLYKHILASPKAQAVHYYFSKSANDEVMKLNLTNLKKAFPNNHKFHDSLDAEFGKDIDLAQYDSFHKMYTVNRIYLSSLK